MYCTFQNYVCFGLTGNNWPLFRTVSLLQDFAVSSSTKPGPSSIGLVPCSKRRPSRNSDVIIDDVTMADCVDAAASGLVTNSILYC